MLSLQCFESANSSTSMVSMLGVGGIRRKKCDRYEIIGFWCCFEMEVRKINISWSGVDFWWEFVKSIAWIKEISDQTTEAPQYFCNTTNSSIQLCY